MKNHVHDLTGPGLTCECGYKMEISRFQVSFDIWDNKAKKSIVSDCFGTDGHAVVVAALNRVIRIIEDTP